MSFLGWKSYHVKCQDLNVPRLSQGFVAQVSDWWGRHVLHTLQTLIFLRLAKLLSETQQAFRIWPLLIFLETSLPPHFYTCFLIVLNFISVARTCPPSYLCALFYAVPLAWNSQPELGISFLCCWQQQLSGLKTHQNTYCSIITCFIYALYQNGH